MTQARMIGIEETMASSGVQFGTSGARGLVSAMSDRVCYIYTAGFLQYLETAGRLQGVRRVAIAGDLRPSTGRIMTAVAQAVRDRGYQPIHSGRIPSPAVALYGLEEHIPAIMVTGSHIPADRNGIKFNTTDGEVLKSDEAGIRAQGVAVPDLFTDDGALRSPEDLAPVDDGARAAYLRRWLAAFPADFLAGRRIGVYQHAAVGRDLLAELYAALGAEVTCLGCSEVFVPVDTEAIPPEEFARAAAWAREYGFDAIVSTDGDSDRPLIADEAGVWLRGDITGILCARFLGAGVVVTPVSCNTAVERCGWFRQVRRTRIGSPYVIAGMLDAVAAGEAGVVGYEANGGFLTASFLTVAGRPLPPLPTRDPIIVHLALLGLSRREGLPLSALVRTLPTRVTASERLEAFPTAASQRLVESLLAGGPEAISQLFPDLGLVASLDATDGVRITFDDGRIVHLRPSGNAPELRCYAEAESQEAATALVHDVLATLASRRETL